MTIFRDRFYYKILGLCVAICLIGTASSLHKYGVAVAYREKAMLAESFDPKKRLEQLDKELGHLKPIKEYKREVDWGTKDARSFLGDYYIK